MKLSELDRQGFASDQAAWTNKLCGLMRAATNRRQIAARLKATIAADLPLDDFAVVMREMSDAINRIRQAELYPSLVTRKAR